MDAPQVATDHPTSANTEPAAATDRTTRDARDKHAPMGRAARDVERRTLASAGLLTEATPVFAEPAHGVARGGVLAALPMLLREGLLDAANPPVPPARRILWLDHHPPVRRLPDAGPSP